MPTLDVPGRKKYSHKKMIAFGFTEDIFALYFAISAIQAFNASSFSLVFRTHLRVHFCHPLCYKVTCLLYESFDGSYIDCCTITIQN